MFYFFFHIYFIFLPFKFFRGAGGGGSKNDAIAQKIQKLVVAINQMKSLVAGLGTKKDDRKLRNDLKQVRDDSNNLIREVRGLLGAPVSDSDPNARKVHEKLKTQFMDIMQQFNTLTSDALKKEREIVNLLESGHFGDEGKLEATAQQFELQEVGLQETDVNLIALNNKEVESLMVELEALNELFRDLNEEVYQAAEPLDQAETNVSNVNQRITATNRELKKSYAMQTMAWTSMFFIGILLCVLASLCVVVCFVVCGLFLFSICISVVIPTCLAVLVGVVVPVVLAAVNKI